MHNRIMISYSLTPELIQKLRKLNNLFIQKFAQTQTFSKRQLDFIHRYARISSIGASTRIENAQLTDNEIDWIDTILTEDGKSTAFQEKKFLIEDKLDKDRERSIEEVAGCRTVLQIIYEQAEDIYPLSESTIRGLHHELMRHYSKAGPNIGSYKVQANSVIEYNHATAESRTVFKTADPGLETELAMENLIAWYNENIKQEPWTIAVACEFVFRFLAIHPFQDGNGRLGRALFLLAILQSPDEHLVSIARYLAIDRHIEVHKSEYYLTLNRCSDGQFKNDPKSYHIPYFLEYMLRILLEALADIEVYKNKFEAVQKLSPSALKVLKCFKDHPEVRLSTKLIAEQMSMPRRTIIEGLNSLLDAGLINKYGQGAGVRYQLGF